MVTLTLRRIGFALAAVAVIAVILWVAVIRSTDKTFRTSAWMADASKSCEEQSRRSDGQNQRAYDYYDIASKSDTTKWLVGGNHVELNLHWKRKPGTPNPDRKNWYGWVSVTAIREGGASVGNRLVACIYEGRVNTNLVLNRPGGSGDAVVR